MLPALINFAGTVVGKVLLTTTVAAASVGGAHATGLVEVPVIPEVATTIVNVVADTASLERILLVEYVWGPSEEAVALQQALNLTDDGWYGNDTKTAHLQALQVRDLSSAGVPQEPITPPPNTTSAPTPAEEATVTDPEAGTSVNVLTGVYQWGSNLDPSIQQQTSDLQSVLGLTSDGVYGRGTREAHVSALRVNSLSESGVPDVPTTTTPAENCAGMYCWPGYSGINQTAVDAVFATLHAELQPGLNGVTIVNGCTPYAAVVWDITPCLINVFDKNAWGADGKPSHEWLNSIWINDYVAERPAVLLKVAIHEAAHATDVTVWASCSRDDGTSWGDYLHSLALAVPGLRDGLSGREALADFVTRYFGHTSKSSYIGDTQLPDAFRSDIQTAFASC
jgi:hypothetical protein